MFIWNPSLCLISSSPVVLNVLIGGALHRQLILSPLLRGSCHSGSKLIRGGRCLLAWHTREVFMLLFEIRSRPFSYVLSLPLSMFGTSACHFGSLFDRDVVIGNKRIIFFVFGCIKRFPRWYLIAAFGNCHKDDEQRWRKECHCVSTRHGVMYLWWCQSASIDSSKTMFCRSDVQSDVRRRSKLFGFDRLIRQWKMSQLWKDTECLDAYAITMLLVRVGRILWVRLSLHVKNKLRPFDEKSTQFLFLR